MTEQSLAPTTDDGSPVPSSSSVATILADPTIDDVAENHPWIGPSYNSDDGLGWCGCGTVDCEVAALLGIIEAARQALP